MSQLLPVCSVCIANYNGIDIIDACIESIRAQDCDFAVEVIVHDDASTDGSVEHIRMHHPDVHLIESTDNVGFCIANNRMVQAAQGIFLVLLNNDAELLPDALRTLHHEAVRVSRDTIFSLPQYDLNSFELIDRGCLLDPFFNPVPNLNPLRKDVAMVIGACLWIPKTLWQELGGFPEWFGSIAEDMYLCCRARLAGYLVQVISTSGYRHSQGRSFGGNRVSKKRLHTTFRRRALSERNKLYVMILCYPIIMLAFWLPVQLLLLWIEGVLLTALKRDSAIWLKIYSPLLPELWRERQRLGKVRRIIHSQRRISYKSFFSSMCLLPRKLGMLIRYGVPRFE